MSIIGAAISGVSGLVGSAISANAQKKTNQMNLQISRENNEAMLRAMREQTALEQTYNSIGAQMQRAMAAGVNPMLLAGAQPTSASSAGASSSANSCNISLKILSSRVSGSCGGRERRSREKCFIGCM